jgi:DMSO/TMAO reductase YedYZ molybdopterin-dependent catalytic subunit
MRHSWSWALGGAAAAALAIGAGEAVAALIGGQSIIAAIGALVIDLQPPGAKDWVVELFGEADKLALEIATAIGGLLVGALLGLSARRDARLPSLGFAAFGLIAFVVLTREPLFDAVPAALTVAVAAAAGLLSLPYLLPRPGSSVGPGEPARQQMARRNFLIVSAGVLAVGAVLATVGRFLTTRLPVVASPVTIPSSTEPLPPPPPQASLEVDDLTPIIVPNEDFYRIDTRLSIPRLDAAGWTIRVHGMVGRELTLSYEQLAQMPLIERYVTIACVSNEVGGYLVGNAKWTGVRLTEVLDMAGVQAGASQIVGRSFDGWTSGFPTAHLDGAGADSMIALLMNGELLPAKHGHPLRLIVPGLFGYVSATKWLSDIELTTLDAYDAYWVPRGWAKEAPILTQSRIDVPVSGQRVAEGSTTIAGVAWAPTRGISRVEVQVDEEEWREARLSEPLSDAAWVQWQLPWELPAGAHSVRVRATDGTGALQDPGPTRPAPDGARGWHRIEVSVS